MIIPLPAGFDASQYAEGETFDITVTAHMTPKGLEVEAVDGMPVETNEAPAEEAAETEMDEGALDEAMGRGKMKMAEAMA
jgi:hypothetical protein